MSEYVAWGLVCVFAVLYIKARRDVNEAWGHWSKAKELADESIDVSERLVKMLAAASVVSGQQTTDK
jgi:uncharacterized membrane protein